MRTTILTAVLSALLLVITPAGTRADITITLSDPNTSTPVMTIQMDSVDISTITSAAALETVLGTASDYTQITTFFRTPPTPLISTGPFTTIDALPVTTFDQTSESFTSVLPVNSGYVLSGNGGYNTFGNDGNIYLQTTNGVSTNNQVNVSGDTLDGSIASVTAVPEASTLVMVGIVLATSLAGAGFRRWRGRPQT